jgi:trans-aconitate methyltransferase
LYPRLILEYVTQPGSLLELGLGHGVTSNIFEGKFTRHVVVEGSEKVIDQFRATNPDSAIDIEHCLFEDYSPGFLFDIVIAGFVFEHVDDPVSLMHRLKTWVRPGGIIAITVPNAESLHRQIGLHAGFLKSLNELSLGDHELGHQRLFTTRTLRDLYRVAQLADPTIRGLFLKPFTTAQLKQLNLSKQILDAMCHIGEDLPELCCAMLAIGHRDE